MVGLCGKVEVDVAAVELVFVPFETETAIEGDAAGIDDGIVEGQHEMVEGGSHGCIVVGAGEAVEAVFAPVVEAHGEVEVGVPSATAETETDFASEVCNFVGIEVFEVVDIEFEVVVIFVFGEQLVVFIGVDFNVLPGKDGVEDIDFGVVGCGGVRVLDVVLTSELDDESGEARVVLGVELVAVGDDSVFCVNTCSILKVEEDFFGEEGVGGVFEVDGGGIVGEELESLRELEGALEGEFGVGGDTESFDSVGEKMDTDGCLVAEEGQFRTGISDSGACVHLEVFEARDCVGDDEGFAIFESQCIDFVGNGVQLCSCWKYGKKQDR